MTPSLADFIHPRACKTNLRKILDTTKLAALLSAAIFKIKAESEKIKGDPVLVNMCRNPYRITDPE